MTQNDATTQCHAHAHGFIAKLFLKQFGSNRESCCFNTTAKKKLMLIGSFSRTCLMSPTPDLHHIIMSENLSFRALTLYFSRTKQ